MYVFKTNTKDINLKLNEVSDFSWIDINKILTSYSNSFISKSLERMMEFGMIEK